MENENKTKVKRDIIGVVVSTAMQKTAVVRVDQMKLHPKYKKRFRVSKKYSVHDEKSEAKVGDKVRFMECRPLSKTKPWYLKEVVAKAE